MKVFSTHLIAVSAAIALAASLGACKKDAPPAAAPAAEKAAAGDKKAGPAAPEKAAALEKAVEKIPEVGDDLAAFLRDETKPMTGDVLEKFLLACKDCPLGDWDVDGKCEAYKNYQKARGRKTAIADMAGAFAGIGSKHIGDASPAIRLMSANLMSSFFGANAATKKTIADAARKEKDDVVLRAMLRTVGSSIKDPEVKKLLLDMGEHAAEKVRQEALGWMASSFAKGEKDAIDKAFEHLDKDASMAVRKTLCRDLHRTDDERVFATYKRYLDNAETPKELYGECWSGLISSWTGFPLPENPDKKAYEYTLKLLEKTPRTEDRPPWTGISSLRASKTEFDAKDTFHKRWFDKVSGWYKKDALIKALKSLAEDDKANWMARTGAVEVIGELGGDKAILEGYMAKYKDAKGNDKFVGDTAKRVLEKRAAGK